MENKININKIIGENISKYRKQLDMTQVEFAEQLNYTDKAISKWERGESIPDVNVLMQICDIFGISMNELCYQSKSVKTEIVGSSKKIKGAYISVLSVGLCWLVATIVFTMLLVFAPTIGKKWLTFIYAIPISGIILTVLNSKWGKRIWNCFFVSIIIWGVLVSICLTVNTASINWLYLIGVPLELLTIIWYFFKAKLIEKLRSLKRYRKNKNEY